MSYSLRAFSLLGCFTAAVLAVSYSDAVAGNVFPPPPPPNPAFGSNSANASSWVAGAHAGYNWQQSAAVFGFETDLQGTRLNSSMTGGLTHIPPIVPPPGEFAATTGSIDWYGTFRGRLGIATGPWLFYGTAGLAYGNVSVSSNFSTLGVSLASQVSELRAGWVVGAGLEYLLRPDVSLSLGYQYVDLGTLSSSVRSPLAVVTLGQTANTHAQFQAVMAGISWRFAPTGPAAPWAGGYVGGHAGGAWGNNADASYTSSVLVPSDIRLKRDIALVGRRGDGLGVYSFRYLWSDTVFVGVMAQEVALIHPDAVVRDGLTGYMAVDYGRLGF